MKSEIQNFILDRFPHSCFHDLDQTCNKLLDLNAPVGLSAEFVQRAMGSIHFKLKLPKQGNLGFIYSNSNLLIASRLDRSGAVDMIGAYSHSSRLLNIISNNYLHFQTLYSIKPNWSIGLIYSKEPGFNTLFTIPLKGLEPWTAKIGGEMFYSPSERAGGMSIGASLSLNEESRQDYVLIVNPIMGDSSLSYTIGIGDKIQASTKFKFNRYSLESDLSLGILFKAIQVRLDSKGLFGLKWELPFQNVKLIFGIESDLLPNSTKSSHEISSFGLAFFMIFDIAGHPSLPLMITGNISGEISIYNYVKNSTIFKEYKHFEAVRSVDCDADRIISASADSSFQLYSLSGKIILKRNKSHDSVPVNVIRLDHNLVTTGADDGSVKLWDISSKSLIHSWKENADQISDILKVDHQIFVSGSDGFLSIFDDRNKKALAVSEYQEDELTCFCLVKNSTKLVVGTETGNLLLFNVGEWGDHTDRIKLNHGTVESIIKWNESMIIVGFGDGSIYSINLFPNSIGKCLRGTDPNSIDSMILGYDSQCLLGMSSTDENQSCLRIQTSNLTSEAQDSFFADLT